jgi:hypothetical protein
MFLDVSHAPIDAPCYRYRMSECTTWGNHCAQAMDDGLQDMTIPKRADQDVQKMISGIYERIHKAADAEGQRFESSEPLDSDATL